MDLQVCDVHKYGAEEEMAGLNTVTGPDLAGAVARERVSWPKTTFRRAVQLGQAREQMPYDVSAPVLLESAPRRRSRPPLGRALDEGDIAIRERRPTRPGLSL